MSRQLISSGSPFEAQVGYSRALVQGDWCFVAGTTGSDPDTKAMPEGFVDQAANALKTIGRALEQAGFSFADVVRVTYYITDPAYWDDLGQATAPIFGDIRPAATCVVAGLIKPEMKVEIEVTAFKG
ncbi:RidA family protein [Sphingobium ummariense]|uniref:Translation initiation inhibitor, yjgF family / endoribonuclease L-PSP n=1 Tax=Sphingobium ummariense RL-3 TaxID=1346791 RepID=T0J7E6_9SPHN|nr:RidA family protein [Sphingobium ummariense]EQB32752.1 translation initiation inhibitor, yjgF family / endoribonuclease L-PSP [Sphingobium ummariense RL-3]